MICPRCHAWRSSGPCPWEHRQRGAAPALWLLLLLLGGLLVQGLLLTTINGRLVGSVVAEYVIVECAGLDWPTVEPPRTLPVTEGQP